MGALSGVVSCEDCVAQVHTGEAGERDASDDLDELPQRAAVLENDGGGECDAVRCAIDDEKLCVADNDGDVEVANALDCVNDDGNGERVEEVGEATNG